MEVKSSPCFTLVAIVFFCVLAERSNGYIIDTIRDSPESFCGEGPHWFGEKGCLYYVDLEGTDASILRYCPYDDSIRSAIIVGEPDNSTLATFITPVSGECDKFVIGTRHRIGVIKWDSCSPTAEYIQTLLTVETDPAHAKNRFNDGKADPRGRIWAGTMRPQACTSLNIPTYGNLYRLGLPLEQESVKLFDDDFVLVSNGLCWDESTFYYVDSCYKDVKAFDYDPETGDISNQRVIYDFAVSGPEGSYDPDGMTIGGGNLWVALFGGYKVVEINPKTGELVREIDFPCAEITSVAFGGDNYEDLYVTSANKPQMGPQVSPAGKLFRVRELGVNGLKMTEAIID